MPSFTTRLEDGLQRALDRPALAAVPLVLALLNADALRAVLAFDGFHIGIRFGLPLSVLTVWTFVKPPGQGITVEPGVPVDSGPLVFAAIPVVVLVKAALAAGYFGSIGALLTTGGYDFSENVRAFFVPFLILTGLPVLALVPLALVGFASPALLILAIPVFLVLGYLFYATPYLVVLRDTGLVDAGRASYELATDGGPYLSYFLGFGLFVLLVSPIASAIVINVPILGIVVGLVAGAVLGLAGNLATMRFVAEIDPNGPAVDNWDEH